MAEQIREMAKAFAKKMHLDQAGATAVEYGLMVALIAAVIIGAVATLGGTTKDCFTAVNTAIKAESKTGADC